MASAHEAGVGRVGVVGDGSLADRIASAAGETAVRGPAADVVGAAPDAVVAVGEPALLAAVREGVSVPVLPVAAGPGYGAVPEADAVAGVESLLAGDFETDPRATLAATVGGDPAGRAVADAMLVTDEPARISEYAVRSRGAGVSQFRADGVAVSTPTGSPGYGRRAGGPVLEPGTGVVGVVPVAPFAVNMDHWVLDAAEPIRLTVERDEAAVELLLDDRRVRTVPPDTPVEVVRDGTLELLRVAESRPLFG